MSPLEKLQFRRTFFAEHYPEIESLSKIKGLLNTCPACGYPTLPERDAFEICEICFWQDDGQDDVDADEVKGGPNSNYSLTSYRTEVLNYLEGIKSLEAYPNMSIEKFAEALKAIDIEIYKADTVSIDIERISASVEKAMTMANVLRFYP